MIFSDGQYQGGTLRGSETINLFDPNTMVIAVYEKSSDGRNLFLTTCELTDSEFKHLKASNGNFVTDKVLNEQKSVSAPIQESTNTNSITNDNLTSNNNLNTQNDL